MAVLNFNLSNVAPFTDGETAVLYGKNGFTTVIGEIPLLCTSVSIVGSNIRFTVPHLNNCFDENFYKHVLNVNDTNLYPTRIKGFDYVSYEINEKAPDAFVENFSAFRPKVTRYSSNIVSFSSSAGTIDIANQSGLLSKIGTPPFYIRINQLVEKNLTSNNSIYVKGNERKVIRENSVVGIDSVAFNQPLGITPRNSSFIKVYIDGIQDTSFQYATNTNYVTINLDAFRTPGATTTARLVRTEVDHYSAPLIEKGDNVSILGDNTYAIANVSYDPSDPYYNAALTANCVYRVKFRDSLRANIGGFSAINQAIDPIGSISNVVSFPNSNKGSLSFGYNSTTYPGNFNLANSGGYSLSSTANFEDLFFGNQGEKVIKDIPSGLTLVRARNVNTARRRSKYSTKAVFIRNIPIPKVQNLDVQEGLFIDAIRGVSLRVTVKFDKIQFRDVTDYEIAYKLQGSTRTTAADDKNILTNLTNFNVVKVPNITSSVDNGIEKISFTINNLDRGPRNNPNRILVKVTPLNGDIRGVPIEKEVILEGKRTPPLPIKKFQVGQLLDNLVFAWQLERDESGSLRDLDLEKIEIRRVADLLDVSDTDLLLQRAASGTLIASVSAPSTSATIPVPAFVGSTYIAQTIDTSGNRSRVVGVAYTPVKPTDLHTYKAYSEDNPDLAFATDYRGVSLTNENTSEEALHGNYPSQNTITGGLSVNWSSTVVDNANGFASGWSSVADLTDLQATANATYVTQVRDVGSLITGKVILETKGEPFAADRWTEEKAVVTTSSTELSNDATVLVDRNISGTIGSPTANGVGKYFQLQAPHGVLVSGESSVVYDRLINRTLTSSSGRGALDLTTTVTASQFTGSVYAIWNPGQFVGDVSNANSYALIAGISNANAIVLGQSYYANGNPIRDGAGKLAHQAGANRSITNAFSNITTVVNGASYEIVNLSQFNDDLDSTFSGIDPSLLRQNVEIRYSASNPFYANSNIKVQTFSTNTATGDGYMEVAAFDKEFRYFQIRYNVENLNPSRANFNLNTLRYTVDLKDKVFIRNIAVSGENQAIDYSSAGFKEIPFVNGQIIDASAGSYTIMMRSITSTGCTVSVYDNTGSVVTGETIQFEARGI